MDIFQKRFVPWIYAYSDTRYPGFLKIGFSQINSLERIKAQYPIKLPYPSRRVVLNEPAVTNEGKFFTDHVVHRYLSEAGIYRADGEWFECSVNDVKEAIIAIKTGKPNIEKRIFDFGLRPEQQRAVEVTSNYFKNFKLETGDKKPHFLWNAKMRFGKTFATYHLAKKMEWKKLLVLTFKPAVQDSWKSDLLSHIAFEGWKFISANNYDELVSDTTNPVVCFGSFQDFLGRDRTGGIKLKNRRVHDTNWDCVVFDEYHYGAWRENAKELFSSERDELIVQTSDLEYFDEDSLPIKADHYLYLSGTPFRAILSGEFLEEQIFNWTYSDEQKAKLEWKGPNNPYASLPKLVLMTYQMPEDIKHVATNSEFNEFDLNEFFSASGEFEGAKFVYENEVQKWLDLIRGHNFTQNTIDLKLGAKKPPLPYADVRLRTSLDHSFWYLPSVSSCYAMANLLNAPANKFYRDYEIIVAAGSRAGVGVDALKPVKAAMRNPFETKSITLSCGKLTTGVTVPPWGAIFMLRNLNSPESYFQAAFRVQSPWVLKNFDGFSPNDEFIAKPECYVFDFAPNRALRQISEYSCRLNIDEKTTPEAKVQDFINFLPVLAYDGSSMKQIDATGILDIATSGTSATLLARRWESALLVNVDNSTLQAVLNDPKAFEAINRIEGFRKLNIDLNLLINKSKEINRIKREKSTNSDNDIIDSNQLSREERDVKSKRKLIQEKLIKFATRIPVFMYLTDYREETLTDIITKLEPGLFKTVTGLELEDFMLLVKLNLFNPNLMNSAIWAFKRYEDSSLEYTGVNKHSQDVFVGGFNTVISKKEFENIDI